jgi:hypothetical protein
MVLYHTNIIKSILTNKEVSSLSLEERRKVYYSFDYLHDFDEESLKKVEKLVNKDNIREICNDECIKDDARYEDLSIHLIYQEENSKIDVSEYNQIEKVDGYIYDTGKPRNSIDLGKQKVDISEFLNFIVESKDNYEIEKEFQAYVKEHNVIEVNENTSLFIEYLNIRYEKESGEFAYINLEGYLLYK